MERREFIKLTSAAVAGAILTPKVALAFPRIETESPAVIPNEDAALLHESVEDLHPWNLAAMLYRDEIAVGKKPRYEIDVRSTPSILCQIGDHKMSVGCDYLNPKDDKRNVLLRTFKPHESAAEEDRDMVRLLDNAANAAHTVTCTNGLNFTGLDEVMHTLEQHYKTEEERNYSVYYMILHPDTIPQFALLGGIWRDLFNEEEPGFGWTIKARERQICTTPEGSPCGYWEARPEIHREVWALTSKEMYKDCIFFTSRPEYLGVYAVMPNGEIGMGILNDYSVARLNIRKED